MGGKVAVAHGPLGGGHGVAGTVFAAFKFADPAAAFTFVDDRLENRAVVLHAAFGKDGVLTAASSSKISDGAAELVVMSAEAASAAGATPLARIVAHATHAQAP